PDLPAAARHRDVAPMHEGSSRVRSSRVPSRPASRLFFSPWRRAVTLESGIRMRHRSPARGRPGFAVTSILKPGFGTDRAYDAMGGLDPPGDTRSVPLD